MAYDFFEMKDNRNTRLTVQLTNECMLNCHFCFNAKRGTKGFISRDNFVQALEFAKKEGLKKISITGGEATMHLEIVDFAKLVKQYDFECILTTNYTIPNVVRKLDGIADVICISWYSQKQLPDQKDFSTKLQFNTILTSDTFKITKDLDDFIDKYERQFYSLRFSTLMPINDWCTHDKNVTFLNKLKNSKKVSLLNGLEGIIYRGHLIKLFHLGPKKNVKQGYICDPNGMIKRDTVEAIFPIKPKIRETIAGADSVYTIGIAGISQSGKTIFANIIKDMLPNSIVLHTDSMALGEVTKAITEKNFKNIILEGIHLSNSDLWNQCDAKIYLKKEPSDISDAKLQMLGNQPYVSITNDGSIDTLKTFAKYIVNAVNDKNIL